jgi:hypothetical protein
MSTWEIELASSLFGLLDGGTAGLVWGYLLCWAGYAMVFASIAEMASMCVCAARRTISLQAAVLLTPRQFAYLGWSISLGQRVCSQKLPAILELAVRSVSAPLLDPARC